MLRISLSWVIERGCSKNYVKPRLMLRTSHETKKMKKPSTKLQQTIVSFSRCDIIIVKGNYILRKHILDKYKENPLLAHCLQRRNSDL